MKLHLPAATVLALLSACSPDSTPVDDGPSFDGAIAGGRDTLPDAPSDILGSVPTQAPTSRPYEASDVAVTVNGEQITEGDIDARITMLMSMQMGGQMPPPQMVAQLRPSARPTAVQQLVDEKLMQQAVKEAGVTVSDEERVKEFEDNIQAYLISSGTTREELNEQIQAGEGIGIDEYVRRETQKDEFGARVRELKLLETKYPERMKVSDEDVSARYQERLEAEYTRPDRVRARHILLGTDSMTADEAKAKAEKVVELARAEGADFAELAKEHSTGPTGPAGGELGWFPREGAMVEPFAAAAFALEVGDVSDVVETQFGYHVIKVTDREAARVVPLDEVAFVIRGQLRLERASELRGELVTELRENGEVVYPE